MSQRLIQPIFWPPNSPNLNPIEAIWDRMKDYIQRQYLNLGSGRQRIQVSLRSIVKESVSPEDLMELFKSMPARCKAIIDTDGGRPKH
ncbi:hypothetical protein EPUL_006407, partial [Erysiphe pulchra]